jgi:hypothetical protein
MCVGQCIVRAAYDTCAVRCVGYAAVGARTQPVLRQDGSGGPLVVVECRSLTNSVGAVRYAASERWKWLVIHTLTRSAQQWTPGPGGS